MFKNFGEAPWVEEGFSLVGVMLLVILLAIRSRNAHQKRQARYERDRAMLTEGVR